MNLIKSLFGEKGNIPKEVLTAAHHEAGHVVYTYSIRWSVNSVKLVIKDEQVIDGITEYDFGKEKPLVEALENQQMLNNLIADKGYELSSVALKMCWCLMGGPVAESYYLKGIDFRDELPVDLQGPDALRSYRIESVINQITGRDKTIQSMLIELGIMTKKDVFWKSITKLAQALSHTDNFEMDRDEIERILKSTGFIKYIDQQFQQGP